MTPQAGIAAVLGQAIAAHGAGAFDAAERGYLQILKAQPKNFDALHLLGVLRFQTGALKEADALIVKALRVNARSAEALSNRSAVLHALTRYAEAAKSAAEAIRLKPGDPAAHFNQANALKELGRPADAIAAYDKAVALKGDYADAFLNRGAAHQLQGRIAPAIADYERAIALGADKAKGFYNIAQAHEQSGDVSRAIEAYSQTIAAQSDYPDPRRNRALLHLARGDFAAGWTDYEWRWKCADFTARPFRQPQWDGRTDLGGTLLIWAEQGMGDELLYGTMIGDLVAAGLNIVWEVDQRLVPLIARSYPRVRAVPRLAPPDPSTQAADVAAQIPVGSLGQFLRRDGASFAKSPRGYLRPDMDRARDYRRAVMTDAPAGQCLVGISWISKNAEVGTEKSIPLAAWSPILNLPGVRCVDLQYGDTAAERSAVNGLHHVNDLDLLRDMDGLAALIAACDVVITVSNTTAHLGGALGAPTWVLIPANSGKFWYWGQEGTTSLWYPSVRLYRQAESGHWEKPLVAAAADLAQVKGRTEENGPSQ